VGWLDTSAIEFTALGSTVVLWTIGLALSVLLWHLAKHRYVAMIWLASTGSLVLNQTLKAAFGRSRPDVFEWLVDVGHLSFPSGHATVSFACATTLALAVPRLTWPLFALATLISFSRVYVGVHYPFDVLAGAALGVAIAIALRTLAAVLRRSAPPMQRG